MKNLLHLFLLFFIFITFIGCSSKNTPSSSMYDKSFPRKQNIETLQSKNYNKIYEALKVQYKDWKGVKYKFGGSSKNGIDCSAFVQKTFREKLNIKIPRTTSLQSRIGEEISIDNLEMGDLVFFKTGFNSRHVGIYLEGGKFLHASTKRGVTISRLDNIYYSKHFWKIKRVIY